MSKRNTTARLAFAVAASLAVLAGETGALAQGNDAMKVRRHFKIERPAHLGQADAMALYGNIKEELGRGYAASKDPSAQNFLKWRRYNKAPYRSATHGNRYVNNYANPAAVAGYGKLSPGGQMPAGTVLAKDSFTVTADGGIFGGALFLMEKLPPGTNPGSGDWRYLMIMPDGSYFGDSTGANADKMDFCNSCHKAVANKDYMFFVPEAYRRQFLGGG